MRVVGRPVWLDVGAAARGDVGDGRVRGIVIDRGNADAPVTETRGFIRVKGDALAVVRPRGPPDFKVAFGDLYRRAARRGHDVQMIPAVFIAEKGNPFAVR